MGYLPFIMGSYQNQNIDPKDLLALNVEFGYRNWSLFDIQIDVAQDESLFDDTVLSPPIFDNTLLIGSAHSPFFHSPFRSKRQ